MADIDTNNEIMEVTSHEVELDRSEESVNVMDDSIGDQGEEDVCEEDILQQAFVEASTFPDGVQIQYTDNGVGLQEPETNIINPGDEGTTFITTGANGQISTVQLGEQFENGSYQILTVSNDATGDQFAADSAVAIPNGTTVQLQQDNSMEGMEAQYVQIDEAGNIVKADINDADETHLIEQGDFSEIPASTSVTEVPEQQTKQIQLTAGGPGAPLGSSLNPIRIIQQGNQYTPVQHLSTEQLQQIMQVVQQQQITKSLDTGSSVLYNQQTNTRIVYRVIYPSDLHKDGDGMRAKGQQTVIQTIPKRTYRKRIKEDEQDKIEGPELTKEEKEAKKKQRAKTRSGRVSKPPKHMVKDYKHIHVLDYDEDYDDSDGGYSDYKVGEHGGEGDDSREDHENYVAPGLNSIKPKNWKCITCEKAYIGRAGLARHLKLYPSHGSIDPFGEGDMEPPPPGTIAVAVPTSLDDSNSVPSVPPATPNGVNSAANSTASLSEDSRDSTYSLPYIPTPRPRGQRGRPRGSRSSGWRGRGAYSKVDQETRRRNKLKEITRECSDEELMEVVLPRLAKVITLWEFLLMKVEIDDATGTGTPQADRVFREYEALHQHVKKLCQEYLQYVPEDEAKNDDSSFLQIENGILAQALGLQVGCHRVKDIPETETAVTYKYKLLTTNHSTDPDYTNKSFLKRTVEVVSPEDIVSPKKSKLSLFKTSPGASLQSSRSSSGADFSSILTKTLTRTPQTGTLPSQARIMKVISPVSPAVSVSTAMVGASSSMSAMSTPAGLILTNSLPTTPVIFQSPTQVLAAGINPGPSTTGATSGRLSGSGQKAVSLLNNSKIITSKPESQKILILSGGNPSAAQTSVTFPVSSAPHVADPMVRGKSSMGLQHIAPAVSSQISANHILAGAVGQNSVASNAIILPASLSNSVPLKSEPAHQPMTLLPINSSSTHPILISLPQSSPQPQILQTKLIVTDPGGSNQPDAEESMISVAPLNSQNTSEEMLDADQVLNSVENEASFITDDPTYSLNGDVKVENGNLNSENVVYTLQNGDADDFSVEGEDSSQTNIVYAVDPEMVLVNKPETDNISIVNEDLSNSTESATKVLLPRSSEEVVGVLNSIDNSDISSDMKMEQMDSGCDQVPEQTDEAATSVELNKAQNDGFAEYQLESEAGNTEQIDQQMAATIFQTEDGSFIIQNADGTTLQLQGTDGQPLSMETVQALLAMDGGTQLITQQDEIT